MAGCPPPQHTFVGVAAILPPRCGPPRSGASSRGRRPASAVHRDAGRTRAVPPPCPVGLSEHRARERGLHVVHQLLREGCRARLRSSRTRGPSSRASRARARPCEHRRHRGQPRKAEGAIASMYAARRTAAAARGSLCAASATFACRGRYVEDGAATMSRWRSTPGTVARTSTVTIGRRARVERPWAVPWSGGIGTIAGSPGSGTTCELAGIEEGREASSKSTAGRSRR